MRMHTSTVPIDDFEHTLRLRGMIVYAGVEAALPQFVTAWSLWDPNVRETRRRFRVVGHGRDATLEELVTDRTE